MYSERMPRGAKDTAGAPAQAVAELIRREMGAQRVSGRKLADAIGKGETYVRERISGQRALDLNDLDDIATALGLDVIMILEQAQATVAGKASAVVRMSDHRAAAKNVSGEHEAIVSDLTDYANHADIEIEYNPEHASLVEESLADRHAALQDEDPEIEQTSPPNA